MQPEAQTVNVAARTMGMTSAREIARVVTAIAAAMRRRVLVRRALLEMRASSVISASVRGTVGSESDVHS